MFKIIKNKIIPNTIIGFKSLRFSIINYFMIVFVIPSSYLVINVMNNQNEYDNRFYFVGYVISIVITLFISMQSMLVANSFTVNTLELYATYLLSNLQAYIGNSINQMIYSLLPISVLTGYLLINGFAINFLLLFIWFIITITVLSCISIFIGSSFKNPNLAGGIIPCLYMIFVMITPIYYSISEYKGFNILFLVNPLTYISELLRISVGMESSLSPILCIIVIIAFISILVPVVIHRCKNRFAVEKLTFR